jgi:hypothetical protein
LSETLDEVEVKLELGCDDDFGDEPIIRSSYCLSPSQIQVDETVFAVVAISPRRVGFVDGTAWCPDLCHQPAESKKSVVFSDTPAPPLHPAEPGLASPACDCFLTPFNAAAPLQASRRPQCVRPFTDVSNKPPEWVSRLSRPKARAPVVLSAHMAVKPMPTRSARPQKLPKSPGVCFFLLQISHATVTCSAISTCNRRHIEF